MRVFVTGSSSHLAAALLPLLCDREDVEHVTGVDLAAPAFWHAKFRAAQLDIRSPQLEPLMAGHDALVHLAFVVLRGKMPEREMFDVNVAGSHKVFHAARRAGLKRLIHVSSAAVYGGGVHVREEAPLNPPSGFLYAQHNAHLEQLLAIEFPDCVRLRPHLIVGPNAHPLFKQLLGLRYYARLPDPQPLLQCVHEQDVARAVLLALQREARGAFNLAVEENYSFREIARSRHRFAVPLPLFAARAAAAAAWRLSGWGGEPGWVEGMTRTLLLNCRRAAVELGWRTTRDAEAALAQI